MISLHAILRVCIGYKFFRDKVPIAKVQGYVNSVLIRVQLDESMVVENGAIFCSQGEFNFRRNSVEFFENEV